MNIEQAKRTLRHAVHQIAAVLRTNDLISGQLAAGTIDINGKLAHGFSTLAWANVAEGTGSQPLPGGFVVLVELSVLPGTAAEATTVLIAVAGDTPDDLRFTFWDADSSDRTTGVVGCLHAPTLLVDSNEIHLMPLGEVLQNFAVEHLEAASTEDDA